MKTVSKICMCLFLASLPALYYGTTRSWYEMLSNASWRQGRIVAFIAGVALFFPARLLAESFFNRQWHFLKTLEHELTHILAGLLFLKIPVGLRVTAYEGGSAKHLGLGTTGCTWIALGPYFFPTLPFIILLIGDLSGFDGTIPLMAIGLGTGFHIFSTWDEAHSGQSDLRKVGLFKSILILPLMNLFWVGSIVAYVLGGSKLMFEFLGNTALVIFQFWQSLLSA